VRRLRWRTKMENLPVLDIHIPKVPLMGERRMGVLIHAYKLPDTTNHVGEPITRLNGKGFRALEPGWGAVLELTFKAEKKLVLWGVPLSCQGFLRDNLKAFLDEKNLDKYPKAREEAEGLAPNACTYVLLEVPVEARISTYELKCTREEATELVLKGMRAGLEAVRILEDLLGVHIRAELFQAHAVGEHAAAMKEWGTTSEAFVLKASPRWMRTPTHHGFLTAFFRAGYGYFMETQKSISLPEWKTKKELAQALVDFAKKNPEFVNTDLFFLKDALAVPYLLRVSQITTTTKRAVLWKEVSNLGGSHALGPDGMFAVLKKSHQPPNAPGYTYKPPSAGGYQLPKLTEPT